MRELDFDIFISQDAGRALYRSLFIYAAFMLYKRQITQISHSAYSIVNHIETQLWQSKYCFVQTSPNIRLALSSIVCSFVPFLVKYEDWHVTGGILNGIIICGLTLTYKPAYLVGAGLIGGFHGLLYKQSLHWFQRKDTNVYESDFKL